MAVFGVTENTESGAEVIWAPDEVLTLPVKAAEKILRGSLVCVNADGYAVNAADTAGLIFQGISLGEADNTNGSNGSISVAVRRVGLFKFEHGDTVTQADVGENVFISDYETVDAAANVSNNIYCGVITGVAGDYVWFDVAPAIRQADVATHIADVSAAHAASAISLADADGNTTETDVEGAIAELYPRSQAAVADPGDGGAIPVTQSGTVAIETTGVDDTRTLAIPSFAGQILTLSLDVDAGDAVVTVAAAVNQTGNNTLTGADAGDAISMIGVQVAGALVWRVLANDGWALSTV